MSQTNQLITLSELYGRHLGVTHWAVSMKIFAKGDFFQRLIKGSDCRTKTAMKAVQWFSDNWPKDADWPADVPRPSPNQKEAA